MRSAPRHALGLLLILACVTLAAAGCSTKTTLAPDLEPQTTLFVKGKLDTVNHVAHLFWFGSDPDGQVVGFEYRFRRLDPPADSSWHYTTATDEQFTVWSPTGHAMPIFEVRAVDNAGLRDPTPASADFSFSNQPPVVQFIDAPAPTDTTFPATTVTWKIVDIDGDPNKASYLLWLDGGAASPRIVTGKTFTVPPQAFLQNGVYMSGTRTLYIQAIDDGGMASNVDSTSWFVRAPAEGATHARLLMLDDVATNDAVDLTLDTLYANAAARNLPAGSYSSLHMKTSKAFRSEQDMVYAFSLFDAVTWTRGTTFFPIRNPDYLALYPGAIAAYVQGGGQLLLEGSYLIHNELIAETSGTLDPGFVEGLVGFPLATHLTTSGEVSYQWGFRSNGKVRNGPAWKPTSAADTLNIAAKPSAAVTAFEPGDTSSVLMWARPGTMGDDATLPEPKPSRAFAVSVTHPGGGTIVVVGVSLVAIDRPGLVSAPALLDRVLGQFGITGPAPPRMRMARR